MTDLVSKILADRALVRAFDDAQLKIIEGVLTAHFAAAPAQTVVSAQPAVSAQPIPMTPQPCIPESDDNRYVAFVDGACSGNPGPGGWAAFFPATGTELVGGLGETTNNQMEIVAAASAIQATPKGAFIEIFTDSQLVVQTMQGAWKRKTNFEFWALLDEAVAGRTAIFTWVKGHAGEKNQERANELAQREAQRRKQQLAATAA